MKYKVLLEPDAIRGMQSAIDYYSEKRKSQGLKFSKAAKEHLNSLKSYPFYEVRYKNVRCFPIKNYPYLIHFTVDEVSHTVTIRSILNTNRQNKDLE